MKRNIARIVAATASVIALVILLLVSRPVDAAGKTAKLRVGVYDNRAIAMAYAPTKHHTQSVAPAREAYKKAKAAGDEKAMAEAKKLIELQQKKLHLQGFGHFPVSEMLTSIKDKLPGVAQKAGVDVIAWECDYTSQNVELVDITEQLVTAFNPPQRVYKWVKQLKDHPPVPLEKLMLMDTCKQ